MSEDRTDSGHVVGDPCEAVIGEFVFGPMRCRDTSVGIAVDRTWGTSHVVCARHAPPAATPADSTRAVGLSERVEGAGAAVELPETDAIREVRRAMSAIRLEVDSTIADDVSRRVEAALAQPLDEVERLLLAAQSPLREPANRAAWGQGVRSSLRIVREVREQVSRAAPAAQPTAAPSAAGGADGGAGRG